MTSKQTRGSKRNRERGAVAILIAALWMTLFGLAALAVDAGYLYQSQRGLQVVADAAVMAGLHSLSSTHSTSTAQNDATTILTANGYSSGVSVTATASQVSVSIQVAQPSFFGRVLGMPSKTLHVSAVGQTSPAAPAVFAGGSVCPPTVAQPGLQFNGTGFAITGDVESNAAVNYYTGGSNTTNGSVTYNPACGYSQGGNPAPTGGVSPTGGALPFPFGYTIASFPACTFGTLGGPPNTDLTLGMPGPFWATGGPSGGTLVSGVYCANGNISLGANTVTGTVTFVATGTITIGSASANLTGFYNNMIAFTTSPQDCGGFPGPAPGPAMNIGNSDVVLNGSFDAPNGCINIGGNNITVNGSLAGNDVQIGVGGSSIINSTGGASGGYYLYQ